jgi:microsomal dipeptidase-like Zn-dependent dipeptidase
LGKKGADDVLVTATGIDPRQLRHLRQKQDYFSELLDQYAFIANHQGASPCGEYAYKLVSSFGEIEDLRKTSPNTIAVVMTIEGAHAFGVGNFGLKRTDRSALKAQLSDNIRTVKSWDAPPLFVNLSHHFNNRLAGHARSLKAPVSGMYNQKTEMGKGISDLGWHVVQEMLSTENGRRMLVDVKHMSLKSRLEFYEFVDRHNRINPTAKIPVICSHTGVNGLESMDHSLKTKSKNKKNGQFFNNWAINLSDEEIRFIHTTGGMVGIILDKHMLASQKTLERIKQLPTPEEVKEAFVEVIVANIFQAVEAIGDRSGWNTVVMGSDYDGLINHVDCYPDSTYFPQIQQDLIRFIEEKNYRPDLWFGAEPRDLIRKVMADNAMDFLRQHFWPAQQVSYIHAG